MIKAIPKWVWNRYALLWNRYKDKSFTYKEAEKVLKHDDKPTISVMVLELRKAGWLNVELSKEDTRMRIYTLAPPNSVVEAVTYDTKKNKS